MTCDWWLLSNLRTSATGIDGAVVWVSAGEFLEAEQHLGPRLMIVIGKSLRFDRLTDAISVRLTDPPEVLGELPDETERQVVQFVALNRDALLAHWRDETSMREMVDAITSITRGRT
jgi:hypothetical protein